jgi:N,N'-diacetyllegionaminate synthase
MHQELFDYCEKRNIKFLSTGFDIQSIDLLVNLGQNFFKIASGEITNFPYLRHIGRLKKPVIISTGMSYLEEVTDAIDVLEQHGTPKNLITALHCTSAYPAPFSEINLRAMVTIKEEIGVAIGYSDHTLGTEASIAAVAMGATVIEKHFTVDRNLPGPDHKASLEPSELKKMVSAIRNIEMALGDGIKRAMPIELENRQISRKSIVALKNITSGELFTEFNIVAKRPGTGISPMKWDRILGSRAKRNYKIDEFIDNET